ncbi:hypothetical protein SLA2020_107850 [Shorea laevis]
MELFRWDLRNTFSQSRGRKVSVSRPQQIWLPVTCGASWRLVFRNKGTRIADAIIHCGPERTVEMRFAGGDGELI